jgi:transcriptional regulator with XRE-family HTH domain
MTSRDIVRIGRQRAGLTQQQLADRSGHPRETIARWETGAREPSLSTLRQLAEALDLDLVIHLAQRDQSLAEAVDDQLELPPIQRLERLLPSPSKDDTIRALRWLAGARTPIVVIGAVAAVLQGGPQRPGSGRVEFVSADPFAMDEEMRVGGLIAGDTEERWADVDARAIWKLPEGGTIALASGVPGTGDYATCAEAPKASSSTRRRPCRLPIPAISCAWPMRRRVSVNGRWLRTSERCWIARRRREPARCGPAAVAARPHAARRGVRRRRRGCSTGAWLAGRDRRS